MPSGPVMIIILFTGISNRLISCLIKMKPWWLILDLQDV